MSRPRGEKPRELLEVDQAVAHMAAILRVNPGTIGGAEAALASRLVSMHLYAAFRDRKGTITFTRAQMAKRIGRGDRMVKYALATLRNWGAMVPVAYQRGGGRRTVRIDMGALLRGLRDSGVPLGRGLEMRLNDLDRRAMNRVETALGNVVPMARQRGNER